MALSNNKTFANVNSTSQAKFRYLGFLVYVYADLDIGCRCLEWVKWDCLKTTSNFQYKQTRPFF